MQRYASKLGSNISIKRWIYVSTIVCIYLRYKFTISFDVQYFDLLMLFNLCLMPLAVSIAAVPRWLILFIGYLCLSGTIGIVMGTDTMVQIAKQAIGIIVMAYYYYLFFKMIGNDIEMAFAFFARVSYWVCLIGFPLWIGRAILEHGFDRSRSVTTEPAELCTLLLPAYYWFASWYFLKRKYGRETLICTITLIISGSSLGLVSAVFGGMLMLAARKRSLISIPIIVIPLVAGAYFASPDFRLRIDDTVMGLAANSVEDTNLSSYAVLSNLFVTEQVLMDSPLLGHGIGSHVISHDRYLDSVSGIDAFDDEWLQTNASDAASMTLRVLSELGIVGYLALLWFLVRFRVSGNSPYGIMSNAIMTSFFLKLIRGGLYFPPEQFFFIFIFIYCHRMEKLSAAPTVPQRFDADGLMPSAAIHSV